MDATFVLRIFWIFLFGFSILPSSVHSQEFKCPDPVDLAPCKCRIGPNGGEVYCTTTRITQESLNRAFPLLRQVNNISSSQNLNLWYLELSDTNIEELDLTPFMNIKVEDIFDIHLMHKLVKITGPPLDVSAGLISTTQLYIAFSPFTNEVFGETLKYFSSNELRILTIVGTGLKGFENEFLPGLFTFSNLIYLDINSNNVSKLEGGQFQRLTKLSHLNLGNNKIDTIGENALYFDPPSNDLLNFTVWIEVHQNPITNDGFQLDNGVNEVKKGVRLNLANTNLTTLEQEKFELFLDAHVGNSMDLTSTPIVCDPKLKWIKNRREEFELYVTNAICSNDPGQTVFTSSLIDVESDFN